MAGLIVNPGTQPLADSNPQSAAENIEQFTRDIGFDEVEWQRVIDQDPHDGRYTFWLFRPNKQSPVEVEMPGWTLDRVRYVRDVGQNIWHFPRLYVDGSSWVWDSAVRIARGSLEESD